MQMTDPGKPDRTRAGRRARLLLATLALTLASCAPNTPATPGTPTVPPLDPTDYVATLIARAITGTAEARFTPTIRPTTDYRRPTTDYLTTRPPDHSTTRPPDHTPTHVPTVRPAPTRTLPPPAVQVSTPTPVPTNIPTATPIPTIATTETVADTQTAPTACPPEVECPAGDHLWLARPVGPEFVNYVDPNYRYGDTQNGAREPHHGVEFQNPASTPVLAVAPGTVIVAGNDWTRVFGPSLYFYGTLLVLELDRQLHGQPVYALYGHLSEVNVQVGQRVTTGETIGRVGASGVALGPHLHFEVRVGQNDYASTRNPELWFQPLTYNGRPWGALAGRVTDRQGAPLPGISVAIRSVEINYDAAITRYAVTYAEETLNPDDALQENFAMNDLPTGTYEISVNTTTLYRQVVTLNPGEITLVHFEVDPPVPDA